MTRSEAVTPQILSLDFETFADVDIGKAGVYRYVESPAFEILLLAYAFNDDDPIVLDFTAMSDDEKEGWKQQFKKWLSDPDLRIHGYNLEFEAAVFSQWFGYNVDLTNWWDTMVTALTCGLPRSLKDVGIALDMPEEEAKLREGKRLVTYFCTPCKPTRSNRMRTRNSRETDPEKWSKFIEYNRQDVVAERAIWYKVRNYEPSEKEHIAWIVSTEINRRGVMIDQNMVAQAVHLSELHTAKLIEELKWITGLENPNSNSQLAGWLGMPSVAKANVEEAIQTATGNKRRVLELRKEIGKTSVAKYEAMQNSVCADGRCRGLFAFYGANRTGRYSSRIVQLQNLPQNHIDDLDAARQYVLDGDSESIETFFDSLPDTLSQLIRTAFIAKPGYVFAVADFSAIEARVMAWVANEKWMSEAFAAGKDIYCATASQMFGVPVEKKGINAHLRQRGKVSSLALQYAGTINALINMGALKMGIPEEDLPELVEKWRAANQNIQRFWYKMGDAALTAVEEGASVKVQHGIRFYRTKKMMCMELPSGRSIRYYNPSVETNKWGKPQIVYAAYDNGKWLKADTYYGKLSENCLIRGTLVLTSNGVKPIEEVMTCDMLWDGIEWVSHEGLLDQGVHEVISLDGVQMTPDHLVLTDKGWVQANEAGGLDWAEVSSPDSAETQRGKQSLGSASVGVPMRLREYPDTPSERSNDKSVMRMSEKAINRGEESETWNDKASSLWGVAFHDTALYRTHALCVAQLRRAWDHCVRALEEFLRKLLDRYGGYMEEGSRFGPDRQRSGVFPGKLSLDNTGNQFEKQAQHHTCEHAVGDAYRCGDFREDGSQCDHDMEPFEAGMARGIALDKTRHKAPVYDIRNSGPRHRFCIIINGQLRLVHNCVQSIARDCLLEAMMRVSKRYPEIVMHVHDEMIVEVPEDEAQEALSYMCACMAEPIPWAPGLLLKGDGYTTKYYRKD